MNNKTLLIVILLIVGFPCLGDEPNNAINVDNNSIEARLTAIEKRLDAIEKRLNRIEFQRIPAQAEPNKDPLRIERAEKQLSELKKAIEINKVSIPRYPYLPRERFGYNLEDELKVAIKEWDAVAKQEDNYEKVLRLDEKNPELDIDVVAIKKSLTECREIKQHVESEKKRIRELIQEKRDMDNQRNRNQNDPVPVRRRN